MEKITVNGIEYIKKKGVKKTLEIKESASELPFETGKSYFIRTVTYHLIGRVERIVGKFLVLKDASWIGDSGRFMNAIKEGKLNEVEPVGDAFLNTDAIADAFPWVHELPKEQK